MKTQWPIVLATSVAAFLVTLLLPVARVKGATEVTITEFAIPNSSNGVFPVGIITGPDGALWFTEQSPAKIGRITTDGTLTEFVVPPRCCDYSNGGANGITLGQDGALWFTEVSGNRIGRITTDGAFTEFFVPTENGYALYITSGPDGNIWFAEAKGNKIGRVTAGGQITEWPLLTSNSDPLGITSGPDGALWFTMSGAGKIGRITTDGQITEYAIPTTSGNLASPLDITKGPDEALWFTDQANNQIWRMTTGGLFSSYSIPMSSLRDITTGPDGALWFTEQIGKIGRITVDGTVTEYPVPTSNGRPMGITAGPDGNIWFTEFDKSKIGKVELLKAPLLCMPKDPRWTDQWDMRVIDLAAALQEFTGCSPTPVSIGVIDTGVDLDHPELAGRIFGTRTLVGTDASDINGHGSHIAGIIAANSNNDIGIAGIDPTARLLVYKYVTGSEDFFVRIQNWETQSRNLSGIALSIRAAVDDGARVINISSGFQWDQQRLNNLITRPCPFPKRVPCQGELRLAVEYAEAHGVVIVAASGNSSNGDDFYPAAYADSHSNVIAVASSTPGGELSSFSTTGSYVTVAAPGGGGIPCEAGREDCILSLSKDGDFVEQQGTSQAAPHVTGVVALMIAANPALTPSEIRNIISVTAKPFSNKPSRFGGVGIVNALAAVKAAKK